MVTNHDTNMEGTTEALERPLVTFVLFAYNQEQYIREAVEGAFAQTYSPLEIILSDDCSTDQTFQVMWEMTREYKGPHKVILNRNLHNLGIGSHINHAMKLSNGEFIVVAAGDDISLPHRTVTLVETWIAENRLPDSVSSSVFLIDSLGVKYGEDMIRSHNNLTIDNYDAMDGLILGASHGWSRRVFKHFGPLSEEIINEDSAIGFRSLLLGGIRVHDQPLLYYRIDSGISGYGKSKKSSDPILAKINNAKRVQHLVMQHIADLELRRKNSSEFIFPEKAYAKFQHHLHNSEFILHTFEKRDFIGALFDVIRYKLPLMAAFAEMAKAIFSGLYLYWYKKHKKL